jgi:hypothetical protein
MDAETSESLTSLPAHGHCMLSDPPGENECFYAVKDGREGPDVFAKVIAEHADRLVGEGIIFPFLDERLHVRTDQRNTEQAGLTVYKLIDLCRAVTFLVHEKEQHSWVYVSASRPHHEPACGGEPHGGVERPSVAHCRHARTVSQMGNDDAACSSVAKRVKNIFVRETMKAVTPDPLIPESARKRKALGDLGPVLPGRRPWS